MYNNNIPQNYGNMQRPNNRRPNNNNNNGDRFFGGFAVPFVLGGITGGLIANNNRPNYPVYYPYYPYYQPYRPYPYYGYGYRPF